MKTKKPTKGEVAIAALADVYRHFKAKKEGRLTRKQWNDFKNSVIETIERILSHENND